MSKGLAALLLAITATAGLFASDLNTSLSAGSVATTIAPPPTDPGDASGGSSLQHLAAPDDSKNQTGAQDNNPKDDKPAAITALLDSSGNSTAIGLNQELRVQVDGGGTPPKVITKLDASKYALFFNGREVKGLPVPNFDAARHSLVFELKRNDDNKDLWTSLLGSPRPTETTRPVTVSLGERPADGKSVPRSTIFASTNSPRANILNLEVLPPYRLTIGVVLIGGLIWLLWWRSRIDPTLRDNLLPQIEPRFQTYSLGRWQMAFWFSLIFGSFVFLFLLTWDYNTISSQALSLMGISGGTALAAVAVDIAKDSPSDAVNRGLRALGLNSYDDVIRVKQEITDREQALAVDQKTLSGLLSIANPNADQQWQIAQLNQNIAKLNADILGRRGIIQTYEDKIKPFLTQGWFKDLTSDLNGTAIHRLQVFCWTLVLGAVYLIGVYRDLAAPTLSSDLLTLMGISGAGYVGFKYPENNS